MGSNDDYEQYEPEDYLEALHTSAVNFVNAVTKSTSINLLLAFDESDIKKLVQVSSAIYSGFDALKLRTHLETLERMVDNDDKLALMMCQQGLVSRIAEVMYRISSYSTTSKAVGSRADPVVEDEDGELTSQNHVYQQCRKIILKILVSLFGKTQYDFTLNHEIPLINPFKYFTDVSLDVLVMNLGNFEDLELVQLSFAVVEHLVIATQANYREDDMLAYQKLL